MSVNKEVIEKLRKSFLAGIEESGDQYHKDDIERIRTNDWWIERFVLVTKTEDAALKAIIKAMKWRKSYGVNDFNDQYFPEEVYKIGFLSQFCKDKEGREIIWTVGKAYHKSSELGNLLRQFTVYQYEKLDKQTSHQGWAVVSDPTGMGLSNVELDYNYFMIDIIQSYYPRGLKYILVFDLPWILNATSKILMAFMGEELRNSMKFIKRDELLNYLNNDSIPVHLKGTYSKDLVRIPDGVKPIGQLTHTLFTSDQIKKIYSTFKAELK